MKVGIFLKSANHPHYELALKNFYQGVLKCGDDAFINNTLEYEECDIAVFWGSWKNRQLPHHVIKNKIIAQQKKKNQNFIVLETPIIGREICDAHVYLRVGINHFLWGEGNFRNKNSSSIRWNKMKNNLSIDVREWRNDGKHILIALQLPGDASLRGTDISKWASDTMIELRKYTNRQMLIRPHPVKRNYNMALLNNTIKKIGNARLVDSVIQTLSENLLDCWCSVTYTSGLAVDSIIAGIPTIACNSGNMSWPIMSNKLSEIEKPLMPNRDRWFADMAYIQWSLDEMKEGLPWKHLFKTDDM